ncbi:MAG: dephospho-CoA kinase [Deltaproteobacteria bacterium]|nr:dephospho-CoA kinase [Deltaproteobacteria bacterium]
MKLIGLTGGIGSGKSTVANWFKERGVPVLDADAMAREVLTPKMVQENFGPEFLDDGQINRAKLASYVFKNPDERVKLELLTHPLIAKKLQKELETLLEKPLVIYEAALIFEKKLQDKFNGVMLVTAPEEIRLQRLLNRGDLSREEAQARISAQMPDDDKTPLATYVVDNSGNRESLLVVLSKLFEPFDRLLL